MIFAAANTANAGWLRLAENPAVGTFYFEESSVKV